MGVVLVSYIYLWCCRLWFENDYVTFIIQIPFLLVFPLNIYLLWIKKDEIFKMFRYYVMRNKLIFISIVLFVFYDVITIFYAMKISYLSTKYIMFFRTLYVIGSLFLCCYDSERNKRGKKRVYLILRQSPYSLTKFQHMVRAGSSKYMYTGLQGCILLS